jgi:DNA-binding response OmpR family regulator
MTDRILIVEDDDGIRETLKYNLTTAGYAVSEARDGAIGLRLARTSRPDLILLDLMLPDGSGLDVLRELRPTSSVPVIILSALSEEADRVVGLELGADDYVVKPFSAREVAARIRSVLRRAGTPGGEKPGDAVTVGDLHLDLARRTLTKEGVPIELSRKEFDLLAVLMRSAGSVVTRERLIDEVWDVNWFGSTKTLDVHVSSLRKKLGDEPAEPRYLHTVRGVGFRFSSSAESHTT